MDKTSPWQYYKKTKDGGVCNICKKQIKAAGGSTSGLHSHLKTQHRLNLLKRDKDSTTVSDKKQIEQQQQTARKTSTSMITSYFKPITDDSLPAVISRLVALDGLPFSKFCTSEDLRKLLLAAGYSSVPKSQNTIKKIVIEYSSKIREVIINQIKEHGRRGEVFSLTFDEWTSAKNRRFMNVNVHTKDEFWNLGLARVSGSMPAEKCIEILEGKLNEFGLGLENIVSITTDGASVMKKAGRLISPHHQLCLAHGIQLAVIKVLYNKSDFHEQEKIEEDSCADGIEEIQSDSDDNDEESDVLEVEYVEFRNPQPTTIHNTELRSLIMKIRKVVKIFRKSPTKNDSFLQKHIKEEFSKEYSLILDCKTRWNSLLAMLERFQLLKNSIRKSLIDINSDINFTEDEFELLSSTIAALQPIKAAVEQLCCENTSLYITDVTLKFMLDELTNQKTSLSIKLKEALLERLMERRNICSDVLNYLHDPNIVSNESNNDYEIFNKRSKSTIKKTIIELLGRISKFKETQTETDNTTRMGVVEVNDSSSDSDDVPLGALIREVVPSTSANAALSIKEKLQLAIKEKTDEINIPQLIRKEKRPKDLARAVKKEMEYFEEEGMRGKYLNIAFESLMTSRPTSVEAERSFSAAGLFCTKVRSQLSDDNLDRLCFLRAFFIKQKKNK